MDWVQRVIPYFFEDFPSLAVGILQDSVFCSGSCQDFGLEVLIRRSFALG